MARRIYRIGDLTFEFEEGNQPAGAVAIDDTAMAPSSTRRTAPAKKFTAKG